MNQVAPTEDYGQDYVSWKNWGGQGFGAVTPQESIYYEAELQRVPLDQSEALDVLEIGFGNGSFLDYARSKGWRVAGTELIPELVEAARESGYRATSQLDELEEDRFDLIVAFDVLEHVQASEAVALMQAIKRVAKPGAVFLARFPNGDSPFSLAYQNGDLTHVNAIGSSKLRHLAERASVELIYVTGAARSAVGLSLKGKARQRLTSIVYAIVNRLVPLLFLPGWKGTDFCSPNAVAAIRLKKNIGQHQRED